MTKRFKDTASVWTQYGLFLMKQGRPDAARIVLEKSLKAVNKKQRKNYSKAKILRTVLFLLLHAIKYSYIAMSYVYVSRGKILSNRIHWSAECY